MENQQRYKVVLYDAKTSAAFTNSRAEINRLVADDTAVEAESIAEAVARANGTAVETDRGGDCGFIDGGGDDGGGGDSDAAATATVDAADPTVEKLQANEHQVSLCTRLSQIFEDMERSIIKRRKNEFKEQFLKTRYDTIPPAFR